MTSVRSFIPADTAIPTISHSTETRHTIMAVKGKQFTVVEQDRNCYEEFPKVLNEFMRHVAPHVSQERINEHAATISHDYKPYFIDFIDHTNDDAFIAYIGYREEDMTTIYCKKMNLQFNGELITIYRNGAVMRSNVLPLNNKSIE